MSLTQQLGKMIRAWWKDEQYGLTGEEKLYVYYFLQLGGSYKKMGELFCVNSRTTRYWMQTIFTKLGLTSKVAYEALKKSERD